MPLILGGGCSKSRLCARSHSFGQQVRDGGGFKDAACMPSCAGSGCFSRSLSHIQARPLSHRLLRFRALSCTRRETARGCSRCSRRTPRRPRRRRQRPRRVTAARSSLPALSLSAPQSTALTRACPHWYRLPRSIRHTLCMPSTCSTRPRARETEVPRRKWRNTNLFHYSCGYSTGRGNIDTQGSSQVAS